MDLLDMNSGKWLAKEIPAYNFSLLGGPEAPKTRLGDPPTLVAKLTFIFKKAKTPVPTKPSQMQIVPKATRQWFSALGWRGKTGNPGFISVGSGSR